VSKDFDIDKLLFGAKLCPGCGQMKAANSEQFGRDATKPDGLTIYCRSCRNARSVLRYRERRREQARAGGAT
jgi:hypothetical protein